MTEIVGWGRLAPRWVRDCPEPNAVQGGYTSTASRERTSAVAARNRTPTETQIILYRTHFKA